MISVTLMISGTLMISVLIFFSRMRNLPAIQFTAREELAGHGIAGHGTMLRDRKSVV